MTKEELMLWRRARGFSQAQLAKLLGVRREAVSRWENGIHAIPQDALVKMEAVTPEGQKFLAQAKPAERPFARWRPYPLGNRDYTRQEIDRTRPGTRVWRLVLDQQDPVWELKICFGKIGSFVSGEPYGLTLPAEAFSDPNGPGEPWALAMHDARKEALEQRNEHLRDFRRAIGSLDDEDIPDQK